MPEVIQDWLGTRIGVVLDVTPEKFGKNTKDGKILAKVLYSYNIVSAEFVASVKETSDRYECLENLYRLKPWFDYIGVNFDKNTLKCLAEGHGTAALQIFYSLYTHLENKDNLHFASLQLERKPNDESRNRSFKVDWVPEMAVQTFPVHYESPLAQSLVEKQNMIQWHKENCLLILEHIKSVKDKFSQMYGSFHDFKISKSTIINNTTSAFYPNTKEATDTMNDIEEFMLKHIGKQPNLTYKELIELEEKAVLSPSQGMDVLHTQKYLDSVKHNARKSSMTHKFQKKMESLILDELWRKVLKLQEMDFDHKVSENILRQSQYEKQVAGKLFLIKHQKKVLAENRKLVEQLIMKSREDEFNNVVNMKLYAEDMTAEEEELERNRLLELHKRLYREKVRLRYEQNLTEARAIVESLVDIAIRSAEYRKLHDCEVPQRLMKDMKELFYKNLPIFDLLEHIENLVEEDTGEEEDIESIVGLEFERQDTLDEMDFNDYMYLVGPWMVELLFPEGIEVEQCQAVLGYLVHKLLLVKYPLPEPPKPAAIKPMSPTGIVSGMTDANGISMLTDLLETRNILIVNVNDVINFILLQYKNELSVVRDIDITFKKATGKSLKKKGKEKKEKKKSKKEKLLDQGKKKEKKKKNKKGLPTEEPKSKEVETQTPRMIPDEDPLLTPTAELGRLAFETLGLGGPVPDSVLIPAIIDYITAKQDDCSGWILLNFPEFYSQASYLECLLTGYHLLPIEEEMDTIEAIEGYECRQPGQVGNVDSYKTLRESRIVPNTIPVDALPEPKTYFSVFVKSNKEGERDKGKKDSRKIKEKDEPEFPLLDNFYIDQKVFFHFEYSAINFTSMKQLAKLIIGDMEVNEDLEVIPKPSIEVFGEKLKEIEDKWTKKKKKPGRESKKVKPKSKKTIKANADIEEPAEPQPEPEYELLPPPPPPSVNEKPDKGKKGKKGKAKKTEEETDIVEPPKPGDSEWVWADGPQPEEISLALATLWESMEAVYVEDFKQVFFCLRLHHSNIILYITFVKQNIRNFMSRPDGKQRLLSEFQYMFNDIDIDLRPDVEIKCELHCRVSEFEQAILNIIDERKTVTEDYQKAIIRENWVADELCSLVNHYLSAVQLEADRCFDSCQVINDYYTSMQNKPLQDTCIQKIIVPHLHISDRKYSILSSTSGESSAVSLRASKESRKQCSQDTFIMESCNVISDILINLQLPSDGCTPYHNFFNETLNVVIEQVSKVTSAFYANAKKNDKGKTKVSKKGKRGGTAEKVPDVGQRLVSEWISAMECEIGRFLFRMKLIRERAIMDMDEFLFSIFNTFSKLNDEIGEMYFREVQSLANCCKVFRCAIEEEVPIQQELQLILDQFIIRHDILLFPDPPPPPEPPMSEKQSEFQFTVNQLSQLFEKLYFVAPQGEIAVKYFIFILQDLRVMISEDGLGKPLPAVWSSVECEDMNYVFRKIYQRLEIVNWKDFIIYALELPFPSEGEILDMRRLFKEFDVEKTELISREDYNNIELWFEEFTEDEQDNFRIDLAKDLLFRMYQVDYNQMNYTALLLAFCKDDDPAVGFQKALALSIGKFIHLRDAPSFEELEVDEEGMKIVEEVLEEIIADTIQETEGLTLKEYVETPDEEPSIKSFPCKIKSTCDYAPKVSEIEVVCEEDYSYPISFKSVLPESAFSGKLMSESVSLIPKNVVLSVLASSFPVIPQLCLLLNADCSLQQSIDAVYISLESEDDSVFAYKLLQHDFMFRILTSTNKFKVVDISASICYILEARKDSDSASPSCTNYI